MPVSPKSQGAITAEEETRSEPDLDEPGDRDPTSRRTRSRSKASTQVVLEIGDEEEESIPGPTTRLLPKTHQSGKVSTSTSTSRVNIEATGKSKSASIGDLERRSDSSSSGTNHVAAESGATRVNSSVATPVTASSTPHIHHLASASTTSVSPGVSQQQPNTPPPPASAAPSSSRPSTSTPTAEMSGNSGGSSSVHRASSQSGSSSSSSRQGRNRLFGINFDLNFDPSSWLAPTAGQSISSLSSSMLPEWVRHPVTIIPTRGENASSSSLSEGTSRHQAHYHHHHHPSTSSERGAGGSQGGGGSGGGVASRFVSHHHPAHQGTSWNSRSVINMHNADDIPLRTRHGTSSMRYIDEDLEAADYTPVPTNDPSGRDHDRDRGDPQSYVIDMDSPRGSWGEEGGSQLSGGALGVSGVGHGHRQSVGSGNLGNGELSASAVVVEAGDGSSSNASGGAGGPRRSTTSETSGIGGGGEGDGETPPMGDANRAPNERTRAAEILRDAPETRAFINEIGRYTTIRPFIVINFLKGIFDHGTSILAIVALLITFSHANSLVKKEVSKQRKRNLLYLSMIVINLAACVAFIYYIFNEMELYYALAFLPTSSDLTSFWSLMWAVAVTDYIAKFGTVFVKVFVVSLPGCVIPFQKRGKYYLFIEHTSQLYRSFLPVYPWLCYLVSAYEGTSRMFGLFLAGLYVFFKITDSIGRFKEWLKTLDKMLSNVHYGTTPTTKQLDSAGTICPICHDTYASPTRLACSHIFCEECVATWFDRERTCPMCRAKVVDDPTYRDGSTSQYIQLF